MSYLNLEIFNCFSEEYKKPFGALRKGGECRFRLKFPKNAAVKDLTLVIYRPGFPERFVSLSKSDGHSAFDRYECVYKTENVGVHYYYFTMFLDGVRRYVKREGACSGGFEAPELFQLTVYSEQSNTPDWIKGGIMYQIFPDRFCKSGKKHENVPTDRIMHAAWDELPLFRPDSRGKILNNDYFGGDLKGIEEKLPYLKELGVSCLYLNPIFEAHENHRYNTANYEKIDPLLGTEEDFVSLCSAAEKEGIRIILDGVFSHTGADSVYFNKTKRYGDNVGAYNDPKSPYRNWYDFESYPEVYRSWWGITTLPNVNETNPDYMNYICGKDGILARWIRLGAAGWRLDVADELPDEFIDNVHKAVKAEGDDKIVYGEVWEDASNKESYGIRRRYLLGNQLDSVMNYPFKEAILNYVKSSDYKAFQDSVLTILNNYPKPALDCLMNFISTHDTERALTRLGGEETGFHDREWQSRQRLSEREYPYAVLLLRCAMVLQFFLPGVPCVYYGDEAGLEGYKDPFNRRTYPWKKENTLLIEHVRQLAEIRRSSSVFAGGGFKFIRLDEQFCVFARTDEKAKKAAVIFLNKSTVGFTFVPSEISEKLSNPDIKGRFKAGENGEITVSPFDYAVVFYDMK